MGWARSARSRCTRRWPPPGAALAGLVVGGSGGLLRHGNAEQRERFLLPVLRGELATSFAFTDAREGPRTTATRDDDRFRVSGVKSFVTDGPAADLLLTVARVVDARARPRAPRCS